MLKNKDLIKKIEVILNKTYDKINVEEFKQIKAISFSKTNEDGMQAYDINELLLFPNLLFLTINLSTITADDINIISQIKGLYKIEFNKCIIKDDIDLSKMTNLFSLNFTRCFVKDYKNINNLLALKELDILFPIGNEDINVQNFIKLENLEELCIEGSIINHANEFNKFKKLRNLSLLFSELDSQSFIYNMTNLKKLYLSEKYINSINLKLTNVAISSSKILEVMDDENYSKGLV